MRKACSTYGLSNTSNKKLQKNPNLLDERSALNGMKKRQIKFLSSVVAVLLSLTLAAPAVFVARPLDTDSGQAQIQQNLEIDALNVIADRGQPEVQEPDTSALTNPSPYAQRNSEEAAILQQFITPQFAGVVGFDDNVFASPDEIVEVSVNFVVPPSRALYHMDRIGLAHNFAVPFGVGFEAQALSAHDAFEQELAAIGISADTIFARNSLLLNAVFMRVPVRQLEAIAALPSVSSVMPNFRFDAPEFEIYEEVTIAPALGRAADVPNFPVDFLRGPRALYNTEYIHNELGLTGAGITVAIIDSGLRHDHAVFAHLLEEGETMFGGWCVISQTPNTWEGTGTPGPTSNHGTLVAGSTIGIAPNVTLRSYRVFWSGNPNSGAWHIIAEAVERAHLSSDVMNLSLGMAAVTDMTRNVFNPLYGPTHAALNLAALDGTVITQAAGNSGGGTAGNTMTAPGVISTSLNVGGQTLANQGTQLGVPDPIDNVHASSSRGPAVHSQHIRPDFLAPYTVFSTNSANPNAFAGVGGTSFSAPIGAAAAALMLEQNPGMDPFELRARIMNSAIRPTQLAVAQISANATGAGRMRIIEALDTSAWAVTYVTAPFAYVDGEEVWLDEQIQMGSINFGFNQAPQSEVVQVVVYDSPSDAGWSYSWAIYSSNIGAQNIVDLTGAELVVVQTGPNTFDVQMVFTMPGLYRFFTGFFYLTYNGEEDITISMPFAGRVTWMEPHLASLAGNRSEMPLLGGNWVITANGFFEENMEFIVTLDGEYYASGVMVGSAMQQTATIVIPRNTTGYDQNFVFYVPYLEQYENYEPVTLLVTGYDPGFAHVTVINATGNTFPSFLALDSTLQAIEIWNTPGGQINILDTFDTHILTIEDPAIWTTFRFTQQASQYILAGAYDMFWWIWPTGTPQIPFFLEFEFEADNHYYIILRATGVGQGNGTFDIFVNPEVEISAMTGNRQSMTALGGHNWTVNMTGFFPEPIEYVLELDGEYFASGVMNNTLLVGNRTFAIPPNYTGEDQVFTFRVPAFEGFEGYEPVTLTVYGQRNYARVTFGIAQPWADGSGFMMLIDSQNRPHVNSLAHYDIMLPTNAFAGVAIMPHTSYSILIPEGTYAIHTGNWWLGGAWTFSVARWNDFEFAAGYHYHFFRTNSTAGIQNVAIVVTPMHNVYFDAVDQYGGTVQAFVNGVEIQSGDMVDRGSNVTFVATANAHYEIERWNMNFLFDLGVQGMEENAAPMQDLRVETMTLNNLRFDVEVLVQFGRMAAVPYELIIEPVEAEVLQGGTLQFEYQLLDQFGDEFAGDYEILWQLVTDYNAQIDEYGLLTVGADVPAGTKLEIVAFVDGMDIYAMAVVTVGLGFVQVVFNALNDHGGDVAAFVGDYEIQSGDMVAIGSDVLFVATPWAWYLLQNWDFTPFAEALNQHEFFVGNLMVNLHLEVEFVRTEPIPYAIEAEYITPMLQGTNQFIEAVVLDQFGDVYSEIVTWTIEEVEGVIFADGELIVGKNVPAGTEILITVNFDNLYYEIVIVVEHNPIAVEIEIVGGDVEVRRAGGHQFEVVMGDQWGEVYVGAVNWTVAGANGASIDAEGFLAVALNVPLGTVLTVRAEYGGIYHEVEVTVIQAMFQMVFGDNSPGGVVTATANGNPIQSGDFVLEGTMVVFSAIANEGFGFIGWDVDMFSDTAVWAIIDFVVSNVVSNLHINAEFVELNPGGGLEIDNPSDVEALPELEAGGGAVRR